MHQLIIAGFHRSGTSFTAKALAESGLFVGDKLLGANESNPHGHYEDLEVIDFHNGLLAENGIDWMQAERIVPRVSERQWNKLNDIVERRNVAHRLWGFKDPRATHFLALWKSVLPDAKILVVFRDPIECVMSLHRRHASDFVRHAELVYPRFFSVPDLALRMWVAANEALAEFCEAESEDVLVVGHAALSTGYPLIETINERWGLGLAAHAIENMFDPSLSRASPGRLAVCDMKIAEAARRVWGRLLELEDKTLSNKKQKTYVASRISFVESDDPKKIACENELLRFENEYLRSMLDDQYGTRRSTLRTGNIDPDIDYLLRKLEGFPYTLMRGHRRKIQRIRDRFGKPGK